MACKKLKLGRSYDVTTTFGKFDRLEFLMRYVPTWARYRRDELIVFEQSDGSWFEVQRDQLLDAEET